MDLFIIRGLVILAFIKGKEVQKYRINRLGIVNEICLNRTYLSRTYLNRTNMIDGKERNYVAGGMSGGGVVGDYCLMC